MIVPAKATTSVSSACVSFAFEKVPEPRQSPCAAGEAAEQQRCLAETQCHVQ